MISMIEVPVSQQQQQGMLELVGNCCSLRVVSVQLLPVDQDVQQKTLKMRDSRILPDSRFDCPTYK